MSRRIVRAVLSTTVALTAAAVPFITTSQASAVQTSIACNPGQYKAHIKLMSAYKQPAVTHIKAYAIGPSVTHQVTKTAAYHQTVRSGWNVKGSASVSTSWFASLIAKVNVSLSGAYRKSMGHTSTRSVSVTDTIANRTRHNIQYVAFSGVTKGYGRFRYYFCKAIWWGPGGDGVGDVAYHRGTWTSYTVPAEGIVSCAAGTRGLGAVTRAAMRIGCA